MFTLEGAIIGGFVGLCIVLLVRAGIRSDLREELDDMREAQEWGDEL